MCPEQQCQRMEMNSKYEMINYPEYVNNNSACDIMVTDIGRPWRNDKNITRNNNHTFVTWNLK